MAQETSINDLLAAFKELDGDGDGQLTMKHELRNWLPTSPEPAMPHRKTEMITTPIKYQATPFNMEQTAKAIAEKRNPQSSEKKRLGREQLESAKDILGLLDLDGDGSVTMAEVMAADTDGDGSLTAAELKAAIIKAKAAKAKGGKTKVLPSEEGTGSPVQLVQWLNVTSGRCAPYQPPKPKPPEVSPLLACVRCMLPS